MFVVVYLVDAKAHIIVPEKFIFGLDEERLKNVGRNSNFQYKIFWAESAIDANGVPNAEFLPDFNLPKSTAFPPNDEACYVGKLKKFFSE